MLFGILPDVVPADEPLRPQFHFTAKEGWLNDPNGLVYMNGEYHLFFQHNPFGTQWGNMTWGHAVSKDLLHWTQLEHALHPDGMGTMFSGSAVIDSKNTSGLGKGMVILYTAAGDTSEASKGKPYTQCLAFSPDGRTFSKLGSNPVLEQLAHGNRDPKVIWHEPTKRWVMALYLDGDRFAIFNSPNLREWTKTDELTIPGSSECPDIFELPVDGDKANKLWVFWSANGRYRLGTFDGFKFKSQTDPLPTNFGNTGYAAQTFYNDPKGRRVQIAWLNNSEFPGTAWNQQMGIPTALTLRSTVAGPRLATNPVAEVKRLRARKVSGSGGAFAVPTGLIDLEGTWKVPASGSLSLKVNGVEIRYDAAKRQLSALGKTAELAPTDTLDLRVIADRASIEVFAQSGLVTMPLFTLPTPSQYGVQVSGFEGKVSVWELKSAR